VGVTGSHGHCACDPGDRHRDEPGRVVAKAELPVGIVAPARHRAVGAHGAGVRDPRGEVPHRNAAPSAEDRSRLVGPIGGPVAELTDAIAAPAARAAVREDGAGVLPSGLEGHGAAAEIEDDEGRARGGSAVAELAEPVPTPAARVAVRQQGARVLRPGRKPQHRPLPLASSAQV
jgi:hypothetical protein